LIGASCCVLPLLAQVGLGAALVSQLSFLAKAKPYLLAVTLVLIVAGLIAPFNSRKPRPIVLVMLLGAAVALAIAAEVLPHYEGQIMRWIGY
jgi:uncharacterized membrane protein (UPF0136 family)